MVPPAVSLGHEAAVAPREAFLGVAERVPVDGDPVFRTINVLAWDDKDRHG